MLFAILDQGGGKPPALGLDATLEPGHVLMARLSVAEAMPAGDYLATFIDEDGHETRFQVHLGEPLEPGYYADSELERSRNGA